MSGSRLRSGRNSVIVIIVILISLISFVTLFNSVSRENDLVLKIEKLEQANEAIFKLVEAEKSEKNQRLFAERNMYDQTKNELNQKLKDQKEHQDKLNMEASLRFNSLQQSYKILSAKHDDFTEQCSKSKKDQSEENNGLKSQLNKVQAQLIKFQQQKDNDIALWKIKYDTVKSEKEKLDKIFKEKPDANDSQQLKTLKYRNYELEEENKDLKSKLHITDDFKKQQVPGFGHRSHPVEKNFNSQILVSPDEYKIPINIKNRTNNNIKSPGASNNVIIHVPNGIINSVENFQMIPKPIDDSSNVLQQPQELKSASSTTTTTPTSVKRNKKDSQAVAANEQSKKMLSSTKESPRVMKALPKGVLPIPDLVKNENSPENEVLKDEVKIDDTLNKPQNDFQPGNEIVNEMENGAQEINDNDFNIDEKSHRNNNDQDHMQDILDSDKNLVINQDNAAEEDMYDNHKQLNKKGNNNNDEMELEINRPVGNKNEKLLNDEILNDHGQEANKEGEYQEDLHIDGQAEQPDEDLGDVGEYDDPKVHQQGAAERN